jgi:hypothetical protein
VYLVTSDANQNLKKMLVLSGQNCLPNFSIKSQSTKPMGEKDKKKIHSSTTACGMCFALRVSRTKRTNISHVNVNTDSMWTAVEGTVLKNRNCLKYVL